MDRAPSLALPQEQLPRRVGAGGRLLGIASGSSVAARVLAGGVAVYAVLAVAASVVHYAAFQEARFDLGNMTQAIWMTAHGHFLVTTTAAGNNVSRLAFHVDPILVLFAPVWRLVSSPALLLAVQALVVSAGAFPVFWLARKHLLSERAAVHLALAYLLFPTTVSSAFAVLSSFHPVTLSIPLVLFAAWYLDEDRLVLFGLCAVLAAATKEQVPLEVGCLGIWYAWSHRRRFVGLTIFLTGVTLTLINFLVVIPHFSPTHVNPFAGRYAAVGGTPVGVVKTAVTDPLAIVHEVSSVHKLVFVTCLVLPLLGLSLLEPLLLLGAVPAFVINLLSSKWNQTSVFFHWSADAVPFLVLAAVFAVRRFRDRTGVSMYVLAATFAFGIWAFAVVAHFGRPGLHQLSPSDPVRTAKVSALSLIPGDAPVAASNQLGGYLSNRKRILLVPAVENAKWVVIDVNDDTRPGYARTFARLKEDPSWRVVFSSNGINVLRHT